MDLAGKRVLIVEDELLVAMGLEDALSAMGCVVIGPVATLPEAIRIAPEIEVDAAVLDVNLRGEQVYPAAHILAARNIPLIFCSGFIGANPLPDCFDDSLQVPKPYTDRAIANALRTLLSAPASRPHLGVAALSDAYV